jgi:double zinc ribbon protein
MADQLLERFHRALIEEIQTQRPEYLTGPFTVAEIYQNLVPYGSHRDRIGVEMNGDYEDALIRLLAGEGGFLIVDSEPALRDLRAELETQNPNTGLYREFAAVDVRLNQAYLDLSAAAIDQLPDLVDELEAEDPVTMAELAPSEGTATAANMGIVPPGVDIFSDERSAAVEPAESHADQSIPEERPPLAPEYVEASETNGVASEASASEPAASAGRVGASAPEGACRWCRAELPSRESLHFCPFCGTDLSLVPCAACGEEIEPEWRFCAACGTGVGA